MTSADPTPFPGSSRDRLARVAVGGAAGAGVRWLVVALAASSTAFPWPTLMVNVVGCFLLGLLITVDRSTTVLLGAGFAGGLTTFSTFSVELARLLDDGEAAVAVTYLVASMTLGLLAVGAGRKVARW